MTNHVVRPREHSDEELLQLVSDSLARSARSGWTLAEVAADAEVHPTTLVKRFGSKRGLLVALSRRWVGGLVANQQMSDAYAELIEWVASVADPPSERERALADMAMLMEDLADDELSSLLVSGWGKQVAYLAELIRAAQAVGMLCNAPEPDVAAATMLDLVNGAALRAAAYPSPQEAVEPRCMATALLEAWR